jgi:LacI family transcriptional regulator
MSSTPQRSAGRRATLQDVSRVAGVSVSAVSKVVREAYGVSPQMRSRVTAAIEELGYRPHTGARAMRGRSYTIGVMAVEFRSAFQPEVAQGVSDGVAGTNFQSIVIAAGTSVERQQRAVEALVDRQVDGLILITPFTSAKWLEELGSTIPTVAVARHGTTQNFDTVVGDDYEGARLVVDHLVGLGHRRIMHTSAPMAGLHRPSVLSHTARQDGYEAAMKRHGLDPDVLLTEYSEDGGLLAAREALDRSSPPTAIFAGADIAAFGVLKAATERQLTIPGDLSVAGYDNIYPSTIGRVALTTVDQSVPMLGSISARLLLERINGRSTPANYVIAPRLMVRGTTAAP